MLLEKPLNKEVYNQSTHDIITPHALQHKHLCIALKKQHTKKKKNKEKAAKYA